VAQFVHQYVAELLKRQHRLAQAQPDFIRTDPMYTNPGAYSINLMTLILLGTIMKKISEIAPLVTDQVWLDALDHALDASDQLPWPAWILNQDPNGAA
jgi:hypothetical protein